MKDERPFDCVCDAVAFQAKTLKHTMEAMSREARKQARSLEQLREWVMETPSLSDVCPEIRGVLDRRIDFWLKDTIAFLRDLCGPSVEEER